MVLSFPCFDLQIPGTLQTGDEDKELKVPAMTTQQFGTLEPFDEADFTDYSERLNAYLIARNIGQVAVDASKAAKREAGQEESRRYNLLYR